MKKFLVTMLIAVMALCAFAACGNKDNGGADGSTAEPTGEATYNLRLATHYPTTHPGYEALMAAVEKIQTETSGDVAITVYPSSQLGDYTLTYKDLMTGAVDMALIPIPSEYDPQLEMNFIPYLVTTYEQMPTAFGPESYFFEKYSEVHGNLGVTLFGVYVEGLIGYGLTELPETYLDPTANQGLQIRVPAIEVYSMVTEDMGYAPTTINYSEAYSAVQTGIVDGVLGCTPTLAYTDFKDVIKYYVTYNVFPEVIGLFGSKQVYEGLPEEYQTIIFNAMQEVSVGSYTEAQATDAEYLKQLEEYGVEIVEVTPEQLDVIAKHVREVTWPKLAENIGQDVLDNLVADLEK